MQEYVDFFGRQPPFDRLDVEDLERLARVVEVEFFAPGAVIVPGGAVLEHLFVVRKGAVNIIDRGSVVDELGVGDSFGHLSLLSGLAAAHSVVAATETLCYRLPDPRVVLQHPELLSFTPEDPLFTGRQVVRGAVDPSVRPVRDVMRAPIWCTPETPIRDAAQHMSDVNQSCVLVRFGDHVGILTDSDCRRRVATGEVPIDAPVKAIASVPARTIDESESAAEALVTMVTHGVHHLVVTDAMGEPVGAARVFDLSTAEIRQPLAIRAAVEHATTAGELAAATGLLRPSAVELFDSGLQPERVSALLAAITESILVKVVAMEDEAAHSSMSWHVLGSVARREPLPCSDLDTAVVWSPRDERTVDAEEPVAVAEKVIAAVEGVGLRSCSDGANASNPLFNRSIESWTAVATRWRSDPDTPGALLLSAILTDSRPVTHLALGRSLAERLRRGELGHRFVDLMLREALRRRPPTGFVRDFVVEETGDHRGELDLKRRGLGPVVALARWAAVATRTSVCPTPERLRNARHAGLLTAEEADTLLAAFDDLFRLVFSREIETLRAGSTVSTYVDPRELDGLSRRHLRQTFQAIAAVQKHVDAQWVSRLA